MTFTGTKLGRRSRLTLIFESSTRIGHHLRHHTTKGAQRWTLLTDRTPAMNSHVLVNRLRRLIGRVCPRRFKRGPDPGTLGFIKTESSTQRRQTISKFCHGNLGAKLTLLRRVHRPNSNTPNTRPDRRRVSLTVNVNPGFFNNNTTIGVKINQITGLLRRVNVKRNVRSFLNPLGTTQRPNGTKNRFRFYPMNPRRNPPLQTRNF